MILAFLQVLLAELAFVAFMTLVYYVYWNVLTKNK